MNLQNLKKLEKGELLQPDSRRRKDLEDCKNVMLQLSLIYQDVDHDAEKPFHSLAGNLSVIQ